MAIYCTILSKIVAKSVVTTMIRANIILFSFFCGHFVRNHFQVFETFLLLLNLWSTIVCLLFNFPRNGRSRIDKSSKANDLKHYTCSQTFVFGVEDLKKGIMQHKQRKKRTRTPRTSSIKEDWKKICCSLLEYCKVI